MPMYLIEVHNPVAALSNLKRAGYHSWLESVRTPAGDIVDVIATNCTPENLDCSSTQIGRLFDFSTGEYIRRFK